MTAVTHLAGPDITFNTEDGQVLRQRCSWCGACLLDVNLDRIQVAVDPSDPNPDTSYPIWPIGKFVEANSPDSRGGMWSSLDWEHPAPVPDNACMRMPLELTA